MPAVSRGEVIVQFIDVNGETDWYNAITGASQPFGESTGFRWARAGLVRIESRGIPKSAVK